MSKAVRIWRRYRELIDDSEYGGYVIVLTVSVLVILLVLAMTLSSMFFGSRGRAEVRSSSNSHPAQGEYFTPEDVANAHLLLRGTERTPENVEWALRVAKGARLELQSK